MMNWLMSLKNKNWIAHQILLKKRCMLVLDVGCGVGILGSYNQKSYQLIGIDKYNKPKIGYDKFLKADLNKKKRLLLKNESFDAVIANAIFEHLVDFRFCFKECMRVLKKDGIMIVTTPNPRSISRCLFGWDDSTFLGSFDKEENIHYHYGSIFGWSKYFLLEGLKIERIISLGYWRWPKRLAFNLMWVLQK